jgi:hypothetical protein
MNLDHLAYLYKKQTGSNGRLVKEVSTTDNGILTVGYYTDGFVEWLAERLRISDEYIEKVVANPPRESPQYKFHPIQTNDNI